MRTSTNTPSPEEQENIKDIREKSAEALKKEFDKKIKSEDGLRMKGSIYKLWRYPNIWDWTNSETWMIVYRKIWPDWQENVITTESNSINFPENEEWNKIKNEYNTLKEEYVNLILNHKPIKHYQKVVGRKLWKTLSEDTKEIYKQQINYLENMVLAGKAIKIRVNPKMIRALQKILWVHDFKWWAYRWTTVYLWHASDLFNEQMTRHEGIHVLQQKESRGFISWLIEEAKEISKYKKENAWVNPNIKYDTTSKIPTEVEAYSNQLNENYITDREEKAYLKWWQNQIESVKEGNYNLDKHKIEKAIKNEEWVTKNLSNLYYDLRKLEEAKEQKWWSDKTTLRIFNYLDKIEDITRVTKLLEKKLEQLETEPYKEYEELKNLYNQNDIEEWYNEGYDMIEDNFIDIEQIQKKIDELKQKDIKQPSTKIIIKILEKKLELLTIKPKDDFNKMIEQCKNEIANENVAYMLENSFTDAHQIKEKIRELEQKCHDLRTEPTCIRLEEPEQVETWKSLTKEWEEEQKQKYWEKEWEKIKKEKEAKEKGKWKDKLVVVVPPIYQNVKYTPTFMDK